MPWKEVSSMEQKHRFVILAEREEQSFSRLCEEFGISRKSGYKWRERYRKEGLLGLEERTRRPHRYPHATDEAIESLVLKVKRRHPTWGPKKLRELLITECKIEKPPAVSTLAKILYRHGLTRKMKRRRVGIYHHPPQTLSEPQKANDVWSVDFKGWFCTADGLRCDALTVTDLYSRYVIACKALEGQTQLLVKRAFKRIFRQYGIPQIIRVDNGTPFTAMGLAGLSKLSVWWIELGIRVEFTRKGCPRDNGSHERMHRTLKAEAIRPPSANRKAQQRRFERWKQTFNHLRPHESLEMAKPAQKYHPSPRRYRESDKYVHYPKEYLVKKISQSGFLSWKGKSYFLGEAFCGVKVGLVETANAPTEIYFANLRLGVLKLNKKDRFRPPAYIDPSVNSTS